MQNFHSKAQIVATRRQFTWRKFLHQMSNFCCGSAFLLHDNGVLAPLKLQTFETGFQGATFRNRNLHSGCVNWQNGDSAKAVTELMLMLAQVNAIHYQTLIKHSTVLSKQVEYEDSPLMSLICGCFGLNTNRKLTTLAALMLCHHKVTPPAASLVCVLQRFWFFM